MDEKQVNDIGNKIIKIGKICTCLFTFPIIGFVLFGPLGCGIGLLIGVFLALGIK